MKLLKNNYSNLDKNEIILMFKRLKEKNIIEPINRFEWFNNENEFNN